MVILVEEMVGPAWVNVPVVEAESRTEGVTLEVTEETVERLTVGKLG